MSGFYNLSFTRRNPERPAGANEYTSAETLTSLTGSVPQSAQPFTDYDVSPKPRGALNLTTGIKKIDPVFLSNRSKYMALGKKLWTIDREKEKLEQERIIVEDLGSAKDFNELSSKAEHYKFQLFKTANQHHQLMLQQQEKDNQFKRAHTIANAQFDETAPLLSGADIDRLVGRFTKPITYAQESSETKVGNQFFAAGTLDSDGNARPADILNQNT